MKFPWLRIAVILVISFILIKGGLMIGASKLFISSLDLNSVDAQTNTEVKSTDPVAIPNNPADLDALNPEVIAAQRREEQTDFNIFKTPKRQSGQLLKPAPKVRVYEEQDIEPPRIAVPDVNLENTIIKDNIEKAPSSKFLSLNEQQIFLDILRSDINKKESDLLQKQKKLEALLERYDLESNQENLRMVELYSQMKPKAAAEIFNELDLETLVPITRAMIPRKLAPILAEMNPKKATILSRELAGSSRDVDLIRNEVDSIKQQRSQLQSTVNASKQTTGATIPPTINSQDNPQDNPQVNPQVNPLGTIVPNN